MCFAPSARRRVDDDEKETTATSQQAAVHEEFASPTEKRLQQGTTAWATEQNKQFDRGRSYGHRYFSGKENVCLPCVLFCWFLPCVLSAAYCAFFPSCPQIAEVGTKGDMSYLDAPDA